jgi:hypothetical protein
LEIVEEAKTTSIVKQREYIYYVEHAVSNSGTEDGVIFVKSSADVQGRRKRQPIFTPQSQTKKTKKRKKIVMGARNFSFR